MAILNNHLIIGLGGTGGKVIREFRKLYERESQINEDIKYEYQFLENQTELPVTRKNRVTHSQYVWCNSLDRKALPDCNMHSLLAINQCHKGTGNVK